MFKKKYFIPVEATKYINLYQGCNIGCAFCKFNQNVKSVTPNYIDFKEYYQETVLLCYSVDPYPHGYQKDFVPSVLKQLHQQKCKIVFLTRNALALESDLSFFQSGDFIGVSISENNPFNSNFLDIRRLFLKAKERNIFTWISLEPVLTYEFARQVIHSFQDVTDFFRVGKNDLIDSSYWQQVKRKIESLNIPTVFVKN